MAVEPLQGQGDFVLAGTVVRPHGLRGEVKVRTCTQAPDSLTRYRQVYLSATDNGERTRWTCEQARVGGGMVILRLAGCADRESAERLVGQRVWLSVEDLPPVGEDEFYLHTLESKVAETIDGRVLGRVVAILAAGGQDILVIGSSGNEVLVPAARALIREIGAERIVLDLPPGLLEINQ